MSTVLLVFDGGNQQLAVAGAAVAAAAAGVKVKQNAKGKSVSLKLLAGLGAPMEFRGASLVSKYLARLGGLYGFSAESATSVDFFLELAAQKIPDKSLLPGIMEELNKHLELRMFVAGPRESIADYACWQAFAENARWASLVKSGSYPNVVRWFSLIEGSKNCADFMKVRASKKKTAAATKKETSKKGSMSLIKNVGTDPVVTRFPPEPSGYLHIGHAKACMLNREIADQNGGTMILRFDDTNPSKEKDEFVDNIFADLKTLGIKYDKLTYTSDSFETIKKYGDQMVAEGKAYIDKTPVDQMREERGKGVESEYRAQTVKENQRLWAEMQKGSKEGLQCVMRAKIGMKHKNKCMRDPALYRCNIATPHHRTGSKWKVYPTYDFACPIVDSLEGVTHALRTTEYHDRNEQFYWVIDALGLRKPEIEDYSRLGFVYTLMSKRKLQWFVDQGKVDGWHDPRFPTVQGIMRRGLTIPALRAFILAQGASKSNNLMEWDKIWAINKQHLDPVVPRFHAVSSEAKVCLTLLDLKQETVRDKERHPKNPEVGKKKVHFSPKIWLDQSDANSVSENEEVTLMGWGNCIIKSLTKDGQGNVTGITANLHLEGNVKKTKLKLTWISGTKAVKLNLIELDHLITKPKLADGEDYQDFLNPKTRFTSSALGEAAFANIKAGDYLQIQRRGYYRCDALNKDELDLIFIPTGKTKSMSTLGQQVTSKVK